MRLAVVGAASLVAMGWVSGAVVAQQGQSAADVQVWWPRVGAVAFNPTTRQVGRNLEVRLEVLDEDGHGLKAPGTVRFELRTPRTLSGGDGERLAQWQEALMTHAQQRSHFDVVSRSYLFRLTLPEGVTVPAQAELLATFVPADVGRSTAEYHQVSVRLR